jgi:thiol:disulfide interchange protein DsbC
MHALCSPCPPQADVRLIRSLHAISPRRDRRRVAWALGLMLALVCAALPVGKVSAQGSASTGASSASSTAPASAAANAPVGAGSAAAPVGADPSLAIRAAVEAWLQGRYKVDGVRRTPVAGLWEVQIGTDLLYVDDKAQHGLVEGQLIEFKSNRNLTQERIEALSAIDFKELPLNLALRQVIGKGTRKVAVFEDANCGHCRNLRRELLNQTDITLYTFTVPILASDSELKARMAWCASDKVKAWNDLMLTGKVPDNKGSCDTPVARISELARKLRVSATPTLFFPSGKRQTGGVPAARLKQLIDEHG